MINWSDDDGALVSFPPWGVILGGMHWIEGPVDGFTVLLVERHFLFASAMWSLGGVAQQGLGDGCMMMDVRREVALSGAVVASTACRTMSMCQYLF